MEKYEPKKWGGKKENREKAKERGGRGLFKCIRCFSAANIDGKIITNYFGIILYYLLIV